MGCVNRRGGILVIFFDL